MDCVRCLRCCVIAILLYLVPLNGTAQTIEKVSLINLLDKVQLQFGVSFSYNNTLLKPLQVEKPNENLTLQETIESIEKQIAVRFDSLVKDEFIIVPIRTPIEFHVLDSETKKTIPVIYLQVNDDTPKYLIAQSDKFIVPNLFATDSLVFESQFYNKTRLTVSDLKANNNTLYLLPDTIKLDEVSIVAYMTNGVNYKISDHSLEVNMTDLGLLAGETDGDVLQLIRSMPGIKTPSGKPGDLAIRGGRFSHNLIYFDNIPIYHQGHFFGTVSPYNPGIVDKMYVYRGALPAKWGGRVGGLVDIHSSEKIPDEVHSGISLNTVYAAAQTKIPLVKNKLGLILSLRSNYPLKQLSPKMQEYSDLNFQGSNIAPVRLDDRNKLENLGVLFRDMNGKLIYNINDKHRASVSFIHINNDFNYLFHSLSHNGTEKQNAELNNQGIAANWKGQFTNKISSTVLVTYSELDIKEKIYQEEEGMVRRSENTVNQLNDLKVGSGINYKFNPSLNISLGYEWLLQEMQHTEERSSGPPPPPDKNTNAITHTFYGNINKTFGSKLITQIGLHNDYYQPFGKWYTDPRISLSYLAGRYVSLKASAGRSHQFIKKDLTGDFEDFLIANHFWYLSSDKRPPLEGVQAMVGASFDLSSWIVDLELYAKNTLHVSKHISPNTLEIPIGNLHTKGADLFIKKRWKAIEAWTAYSLSETLADFGTTNVVYFDQTHSVNLMLMANYHRWNAAISWDYSTGLPVILPDLNKENTPNPDAPESIDVPYKNRFPAQHQLDFSLTYQLWPQEHRLKGVVGLSFLNLYNRENIINLYQKQISKYDLYRNTIGFSPNLQVSISF